MSAPWNDVGVPDEHLVVQSGVLYCPVQLLSWCGKGLMVVNAVVEHLASTLKVPGSPHDLAHIGEEIEGPIRELLGQDGCHQCEALTSNH